MIHKPMAFKRLNDNILIVIPIKGRRVINPGSGLHAVLASSSARSTTGSSSVSSNMRSQEGCCCAALDTKIPA